MTIDLAGRTAHLDRLAAELRAAHGVTVAAHAVDLACPGIGVELRDQLAGEGIRISTLINNAGFATYNPFVEEDIARITAEILRRRRHRRGSRRPLPERRAGRGHRPARAGSPLDPGARGVGVREPALDRRGERPADQRRRGDGGAPAGLRSRAASSRAASRAMDAGQRSPASRWATNTVRRGSPSRGISRHAGS